MAGCSKLKACQQHNMWKHCEDPDRQDPTATKSSALSVFLGHVLCSLVYMLSGPVRML